MNLEIQPHLQLKKGMLPERVIVCGDPARAYKISTCLEDSEELEYNREYRSFKGLFRGVEVGVVSHGIGSGGSAICFNELANLDVKKIIRVGTCGALCENLSQGDIIICTGAVREEGTTSRMVPVSIPAVPDIDITNLLYQNSLKMNSSVNVVKSIVVSHDCFYPGPLPNDYELYSKLNICGIEMEFSTLFIISQIKNIKCGGIAVIDGSPMKWHEGDYNPMGEKVTLSKENMISVALNTIIS